MAGQGPSQTPSGDLRDLGRALVVGSIAIAFVVGALVLFLIGSPALGLDDVPETAEM